MRPFISGYRGLTCVLALFAARGAGMAAMTVDELLTDAEIAALERENGMWRLANPDEGLAANVARLKQAGYTEEEITALQPRLAAMWSVPFERNYGWLRPETIERIRAIDREFVGRMRAVQLFERTGVQVNESGRETTAALNRQWRVALVQALANDELAEFQLMNSTAARHESRLARGLRLTADEQRTLFEWRRDYDGRHGPALLNLGGLTDWQRGMVLDHCRRIRDLLGDERFVVYLGRANPDFGKMSAALVHLGETKPTVHLDLWWLRQRDARDISRRAGQTADEREARMAAVRKSAATLLGDAHLAAYLDLDDGRWLQANPLRRTSDPREVPETARIR